MDGKVGGSPCCGIRGFFYSYSVCHKYKEVAYLFVWKIYSASTWRVRNDSRALRM